jgi:hypothetical protein
MPTFNVPRGRDAVDPEKAPRRGGSFKPFLPQIKWSDDKDEKYIAFLHPIESVPGVLVHEFIEIGRTDGGKPVYGFYLSRKTEGINEDYDDLEDRLGQTPSFRNIFVGVELEPIVDAQARGRKAVKGFKVATTTFTRRGDDGDEEVEVPLVGFIQQSPGNFGGYLGSFADTEGNIEETAFKITRRGKKGDSDTKYDFVPYFDASIDYDALFEHIEGLSYLKEEFEEGFQDELDAVKDDRERAILIGETVLERRIQDLGDKDRYDSEIGPIEELPEGRYSKKKKDDAKRERPARKRQGASSDDDAPADEPEEEAKPSNRAKFAEVRERAAKRRAQKADD